jgi:hypothetical protein
VRQVKTRLETLECITNLAADSDRPAVDGGGDVHRHGPATGWSPGCATLVICRVRPVLARLLTHLRAPKRIINLKILVAFFYGEMLRIWGRHAIRVASFGRGDRIAFAVDKR